MNLPPLIVALEVTPTANKWINDSRWSAS